MELKSVTIIRNGVHFCWTKTLKVNFFSFSTASVSPRERTFKVTGIISAVSPRTPMMPEWRALRKAAAASGGVGILFGWKGAERVVRTSALLTGLETGPKGQKGRGKRRSP